MCATCDPAYVDPAAPGSSSSSSKLRRFTFHRNQCVDCAQSWGATWFLLFALFLLFLAYIGLGIFAQINSIDDKALLNGPSNSSSDTSSTSGASKRAGKQELPCWQDCWRPGAAGAATETAAAVTQPGAAAKSATAQQCSNTLGLKGAYQVIEEAVPEECVTDAAAAAGAGSGSAAPMSPFVAVQTAPNGCSASAAVAAVPSGQVLPVLASVGTANAGTAAPPPLPQQQPGTGAAAVAVAATAGGGGAAGGGASSTTVAAAGTDNPVHTLVAMWKVLTSYVQVRLYILCSAGVLCMYIGDFGYDAERAYGD